MTRGMHLEVVVPGESRDEDGAQHIRLAQCGSTLLATNWAPWSVLKISGVPNLASASSSAARQKSVVMVLESRKASTLRLATSRIATSYIINWGN